MKKFTLTLFVTLLAGIQVVLAQDLRVAGKVSDANGAPLAGVTIVVEGTQRGTTTTADGAYTITAPGNGSLNFSFVGMVPVIVPVEGRNMINVVMESDTELLDEVVVVAFGTMKKRDLTGAVTSVGSDQLQLQPVSTASRALDGAVSGVSVYSNSGQPGSDANIYIRGIGSINADRSALVVIDGVPTNTGLATLNPQDIESMVVSKDATSNALYGSRAANGVVLVTTKKGKQGQGRITFDMRLGQTSQGTPDAEKLNSREYYEYFWAALYNTAMYGQGKDDAASRIYAQDNLLSTLGNYAQFKVASGRTIIDPSTGKLDASAEMLYNDDWKKILTSPAFRQEYNITASGGNEKNDYYVSLGYLDEPSYVIRSKMERYTGRAQFNSQVKSWFKTGANVAYSRRETNEPTAYVSGGASSNNVFQYLKWMGPIYPLYARNADGTMRHNTDGSNMWDYGTGQTLSDYGTTSRAFSRGYNPEAYMMKDIFTQTRDNISGSIYGEVKFLKDFTLTASVGLDNIYRTQTSFQNNEEGITAGPPYNGYMTKYQNQLVSYTTTQILNYRKDFGGRHNVIVDLGHEYFQSNYRYQWASKMNIFIPGVPELDNAVTDNGSSSYTRDERLEGYFGRAYYTLDDKYILSGSVRADGSSRFKYDKWGTFWSVGAAWRISSENWMQNSGWLNDLKLRASYGTSGNKNVWGTDSSSTTVDLYYPYTNIWELVNTGTQPNGMEGIGLSLYTQGYRDLTWETNHQMDIGLDFILFNGRLSGTLDYYRRTTKDMIWFRPTPASTGLTTRIENVGEMQNNGFEADLTYSIFNRRDLSWTVSANIATNKQKITKLPPNYEDPYVSGSYLRGTGKSYYNLYLYKYAGVNPDNGEALFSGKSLASGEEITVNYANISTIEKTEIGDAMPDAFGGFNTTFRWKNLDFAVYTSFQIGGKVRYGELVNISYDGRAAFAVSADARDAWSPTNKNTGVPRPYMHGSVHTTANSDRFYFDASYFSLKTVNIGYTLPKSITSRIGMSNLRLSFSMDNIWYTSAKKGLDPRRDFGGGDSYTFGFPQSRNWSFGLNVSF